MKENIKYVAVNGLFGELLDFASDEVILQLVSAKCTPNFVVRWVFSVWQGRYAVLTLHF